MEYTPFQADEPPEAFRPASISYVADPEGADVIVALRVSALQRFRNRPSRFAIWTHEPRVDVHLVSPVKVYAITQPVHVMNVYTGVFGDNCRFIGRPDTPLINREVLMQGLASKPWRAVMLATYRPTGAGPRLARPDPVASLVPMTDGRLLWHGRDVDLTLRRQSFALHLQQCGFCDIYGRGWPEAARVSGESRFADWRGSKQEVLKNYAINLAFENTIAPHYVTEKIWDAIKGACLPVYHGGDGSTIYDDFPRGSFIEAAGKTDEELAYEIMTMGRREAAERYEACLEVYLRCVREERHQRSVAAMLARTARFLEAVMETSTAGSPEKEEAS